MWAVSLACPLASGPSPFGMGSVDLQRIKRRGLGFHQGRWELNTAQEERGLCFKTMISLSMILLTETILLR